MFYSRFRVKLFTRLKYPWVEISPGSNELTNEQERGLHEAKLDE